LEDVSDSFYADDYGAIMRSDIVELPANVGVISARTNRETAATP
jgi:hypothetical protein